jgi:hypothetical protein
MISSLLIQAAMLHCSGNRVSNRLIYSVATIATIKMIGRFRSLFIVHA